MAHQKEMMHVQKINHEKPTREIWFLENFVSISKKGIS